MPKFTIVKSLRIEIDVEADDAQAAWEQQLELNDNTFRVLDCDYTVYDADGEDVSDEVEIS